MFRRDFMDYHSDRFEDHSLLVFKNDKVIALLPANYNGQTLYSHQGLTYGGLIIQRTLKFQDILEAFKMVLQFLNRLNIGTLVIKQMPSIYTSVASDELLYIMFLLQAQLYRRDMLSVVNLQVPIQFSKDRIAGCKRAIKHHLEIKETNEFEAFWNDILIPNLQEKHKTEPVHTLQEIKMLKARFPNQIRQFNVYYNGDIVAGTTIFDCKHVAHSQYISANASKNTLGSLDALHQYLISKVFKDKHYFDFGISNENNGKQLNKGLLYWKEGFGANAVAQDFYKVETQNYKLLDDVWV